MAMRLVRPGTLTDGESVSNDDVPRRADGGEGVLEGDNGVGRGKEVVLRVVQDTKVSEATEFSRMVPREVIYLLPGCKKG